MIVQQRIELDGNDAGELGEMRAKMFSALLNHLLEQGILEEEVDGSILVHVNDDDADMMGVVRKICQRAYDMGAQSNG